MTQPQQQSAPSLKPMRCPGCGRLLAMVQVGKDTTVEIVCGSCNLVLTASRVPRESR